MKAEASTAHLLKGKAFEVDGLRLLSRGCVVDGQHRPPPSDELHLFVIKDERSLTLVLPDK